MSLTFQLLATAGLARRGRLATPHGTVETPAFMPVGTLGAVKGVTPQELAAAGASVMLSNLYHLALRPGVDTVERLGGIHAFTGWSGPILTDSGGYQVFSLEGLRKVDDGGVTFRSHLDGSVLRFTPEIVVDLQERMGVDIAMVLDECPPW
ncbi:MAG TPA: tRNA guanosine(34) transglycosylase Tgt, partial [Thermoanaerobaculia bacterium]|nr:tRNA guanosine(34) transglycosylase Tgt [Thermoanaerobaculia bacterium]